VKDHNTQRQVTGAALIWIETPQTKKMPSIFASTVSNQLTDEYASMQRHRKKIIKNSSSGGNLLKSEGFLLTPTQIDAGVYESGLFPVNVDEQFTLNQGDDEKIILHGKLEPCRYRLDLKRLAQAVPEAITIHIEATELDFEAVMTAKELQCTKEFNLFKKDGDIDRVSVCCH